MSVRVTLSTSFPQHHPLHGSAKATFLVDSELEAKKLRECKRIEVYRTRIGNYSHKVIINGAKMALCTFLYGQERRCRKDDADVLDLTQKAFKASPRLIKKPKVEQPVVAKVVKQADVFEQVTPTQLTTDETQMLADYLVKDIIASLQCKRLKDRPLPVLKQIKALLA